LGGNSLWRALRKRLLREKEKKGFIRKDYTFVIRIGSSEMVKEACRREAGRKGEGVSTESKRPRQKVSLKRKGVDFSTEKSLIGNTGMLCLSMPKY